MAKFDKFQLTHTGRLMIADCQANAKTLNITYCKTSSHNYYNDDLDTLTDLLDIKQSVLISEKEVVNDVVKLTVNIDNTQLITGYDFYTYGIWANNGGSDVLFAVGANNNGDEIPAISESIWQTLIVSNITITNAPDVSITVDPAANATKVWVENKITETKTWVSNTFVEKKTTTGSFAYTHNGATQGETGISQSPTANSIAQRDSNNYLFANTPVGSSDNALVNKGRLNAETTVTIPNSGWSATATNGLYSITINVPNMYPSYVGTQAWDIDRTGSATDIETREDMASSIKRIESGTNQITVYATEKPTSQFQIRFFGL